MATHSDLDFMDDGVNSDVDDSFAAGAHNDFEDASSVAEFGDVAMNQDGSDDDGSDEYEEARVADVKGKGRAQTTSKVRRIHRPLSIPI